MPELIDTLTEDEPEEPTFIVDEVDSDTAQATFPKTFTITVGGDTTLGSTDDLRKRDDCFEKVAGGKRATAGSFPVLKACLRRTT